jgi:hypothetical protein
VSGPGVYQPATRARGKARPIPQTGDPALDQVAAANVAAAARPSRQSVPAELPLEARLSQAPVLPLAPAAPPPMSRPMRYLMTKDGQPLNRW